MSTLLVWNWSERSVLTSTNRGRGVSRKSYIKEWGLMEVFKPSNPLVHVTSSVFREGLFGI